MTAEFAESAEEKKECGFVNQALPQPPITRLTATQQLLQERLRALRALGVRSRAAITRIVLLEVIAMMQEEHARQMGRSPEEATAADPEGETQDAGDS